MKHIDVKYHFVRKCVNNGETLIVYCTTEEMLAGPLTKALPKVHFKYLCSGLGLCRSTIIYYTCTEPYVQGLGFVGLRLSTIPVLNLAQVGVLYK